MNDKLSDKEILYFYDILHWVENKIKKGEHKGYKIDDKRVLQFRKSKQVKLERQKYVHYKGYLQKRSHNVWIYQSKFI